MTKRMSLPAACWASSANPLDSITECPSARCLTEEFAIVSEDEIMIKSPLTLVKSPAESATALSLAASFHVESETSLLDLTTRSGGMSLLCDEWIDKMAGSFFRPSKDSVVSLSNLRDVNWRKMAVVSPRSSIALEKFLTQKTIAASEGMASIRACCSMNCPVSTVFFSLPFPEYKEKMATAIPPARMTLRAIRRYSVFLLIAPRTCKRCCLVVLAEPMSKRRTWTGGPP